MFADLHVVTAVSNPERYRSRYSLYKNFERHCIDSGAKLHTVELAFGERPFEVTVAGCANHVRLRTKSQVWHKENLLNVGISRLPSDWKYVAWVDCDVTFARPDWVAETVQQLQHFSVVQMFSHLVDLGPDYTPAPAFYADQPLSFAYCHAHNLTAGRRATGGYGVNGDAAGQGHYWHPGFAWAARREAIDDLGGLIDWAITGGADYLMALCLTGARRLPAWAEDGSQGRALAEWKGRCDRYVRGNVGYVPGVLLHNWHGRKAQRFYKERWQVLLDNGFDPDLDLKKDSQGVWQLTDRCPRLRDDLRNYFRARNEDSVDVA